MQFFKLGFFRCVSLISFLGIVFTGSAQNYQLHTVYIYSFTKYIKWPSENTDSFRIGVLGRNSEVIPHLQKMAASKKVGSRPIIIEVYPDPESVQESEIIFLDKQWSEGDSLVNAWMEKARDEHFLLLTDEQPNTGLSHINFKYDDDKLTFELNRRKLERAGLQVSTELLALAKIVDNQTE